MMKSKLPTHNLLADRRAWKTRQQTHDRSPTRRTSTAAILRNGRMVGKTKVRKSFNIYIYVSKNGSKKPTHYGIHRSENQVLHRVKPSCLHDAYSSGNTEVSSIHQPPLRTDAISSRGQRESRFRIQHVTRKNKQTHRHQPAAEDDNSRRRQLFDTASFERVHDWHDLGPTCHPGELREKVTDATNKSATDEWWDSLAAPSLTGA